jgi:hypothetical protein
LLDRGLRWSRRRDDELTHRAKQYISALRRCRSEADRRRLACRMPEISGALAIVAGEPTARQTIEAWFLAGAPTQAIAPRCGVTIEAAEAYEQLFFNVSDRLTSTSYILFHAVGAASYRGFAGDDSGAVLKWFAYMAGPTVLGFLLGERDTTCEILPTEDHAIPADEAVRSARLRRIALAAKALPINESVATPLIRLCAFHAELRGTSSAGARDVLSASLVSMLGALNPSHVNEVHSSVGTDQGDRHDPSEVTPDSALTDDPVGIDLLKFAEVVATTHAERAPESRITGARRRA